MQWKAEQQGKRRGGKRQVMQQWIPPGKEMDGEEQEKRQVVPQKKRMETRKKEPGGKEWRKENTVLS